MLSNWKNFREKKPRKSGLYFVKIYHKMEYFRTEICYYHKRSGLLIRFEDNYNLMYISDFTPEHSISWAKIPVLNDRVLNNLRMKGITCLHVK